MTPDPQSRPPLRLAVLISGGGSTLRNILERIGEGRLNAEVVGVVASRDCGGLQHAADFNVPSAIVERGQPFDAADFAARITAQLEQWQPGLIIFGGFLSLYLLPEQYRGRAINTHPALLPAFGGQGMYGDRVHQAVLDSGTRVTGCTVHLVDDEYDHGGIVLQKVVPVLPGDTVSSLGERVRLAERELLPLVISLWAEGRISVDGSGRLSIADRELFSTSD
ncbi:phosphoribosylglycinamide formyltransferase [bacterium]|nr:phosphoribosylglycinamide formyltransferase [bacterium]